MKLRLKKPISSPFYFMSFFLLMFVFAIWLDKVFFFGLQSYAHNEIFAVYCVLGWTFSLWVFSLIIALISSFRIERCSSAPREEVAGDA